MIAVRLSEGARQSRALSTLCAVLFLTFLDNTIVSVALANIQTDFGAAVTQLQWVVNGYALVFASLMLAGGTLGDLFGRKKVMLGGVAVFCAGSILAAVAPSVGWLIAGRVVMGIGAAASEPGTLSMLRQIYPDRRERAQALGAWAAVSGLALALGPVVGGVLIGFGGWRDIFWFNLGFGALAFVAAAVALPENADPQGRRLDLPGLVLGALALATGTYGVISGETSGYTTWWIIVLFAASVVCGVGFVLVERRSASPVIDLRFFRRPAFTGANAVAFANYFGVFAIFFFVALYLQVIASFSGYRIALQFLPMTAVMITSSVLTGRWVGAVGARIPMAVGCFLGAVGMFVTDALLGPNVGYAPLAGALVLVGLGFGIALVPVTSAALTAVPAQRSGMAASATNTSRELGAVFGVAVLGAVVDSQLTSHLVARLQQLGIPANFQSIVIQGVEHGGLTGNPQSKAGGANAGLVQQVINAAYQAFYAGLDVALLLSGALLLAATAVSLLLVRRRRGVAAEEVEEEQPGRLA